jgi:hypothetical protein
MPISLRAFGVVLAGSGGAIKSSGKCSRSPSANNWGGTSATLSELSKNWDEDLESLEFHSTYDCSINLRPLFDSVT